MSNFLHTMITHITFLKNLEALHHIYFLSFESLGIDFDENKYEMFFKHMVKINSRGILQLKKTNSNNDYFICTPLSGKSNGRFEAMWAKNCQGEFFQNFTYF